MDKWTMARANKIKEFPPITSAPVSPEGSGLDQLLLYFVPASNSEPTTESQIHSPNQSLKTPPLLVSLLPASRCQPPPIRAKWWFFFFFFFWTIKPSHSLPASEFQPHASDGGWGPCYSTLWIKSLICFSYSSGLFYFHRPHYFNHVYWLLSS